MKAKKDVLMQNRIFLWIAIATGVTLLIPLVAMQLTNEVNWSLNDFFVMGLLIFGVSFLFVLVARVTSKKYRVLIGLGFLIAFLLVWAHLAVGLVDSWPLAGS